MRIKRGLGRYVCAAVCFTLLLSCGRKEHDASVLTGNRQGVARQIVSASIDKHGGLEAWKSLNSISYSKTTILFDSSGAIESTTTQYHAYHLHPELSGTIRWDQGEDHFRIEFHNEKAIMFVNNEVDEAKAESATSTVQSSLFVLFQPFKLLDNGVELKYVGKDSISSKSFVDVIQPLYGNENNGSDRWWFYFDTKTYLLAANMVSHNGRYSFIENLAYDSSTHFIFNAHRKSYFVDSLKNTKILRAEYFYKDLVTNHYGIIF